MRAILAAAFALALSACASGGTAKREVNAVVQNEGARQAAAATAQQGESSDAALKAGADAAATEKAKTDPPT